MNSLSLTKDMTGKEDGYRATAIRALCKITDMTMLTAIERYGASPVY